ncbi:translation initiation factor IF-2 [Candidatus Dependentiae bacterium]|nr:translation initiation factor IF-2 [Candidatus Dependentiae bacterium]
MRVYEFAKQKGVTSREILKLLEKVDIGLTSHMSVVPEKGIVYLNKLFDKEKEEKKTVPPKKKQEVAKAKAVKSPTKTGRPIQDVMKNRAVEQKKPTSRVFRHQGRRKKTQHETIPVQKNITHVIIENDMPLFEVAEMLGKSPGELILVLLKKGMACNRNNILSIETIAALAEFFGIEADIKPKDSLARSKVVEKQTGGQNRWPIVVVMGHVDHGKTTLLDYLRKMNTAAREKGGITQHLGAYEVSGAHGKIVFLDTPGHEAFTSIRSRGASVTDIAVLIIAADDGVKPQTIEAIQLAKDAEVPIIVAINKIDKIQSNSAIQSIKRQLAERNLIVEDWGGEIVCVPISAKTGKGVEELIEMIVLQSQMMDLRAAVDVPARAFVLESKQEKGHGPVATVISVEGTLKQGDFFLCGRGTGKIRLLINSFGEKIFQAGPSVPVKVVGFDSFAEIGDWLTVVSPDKYKTSKKISFSGVSDQASRIAASINLESKDQINLIIKTDTRGSKDAIEKSIFKLAKKSQKDFVPLYIVQSGIGHVSESDVELADATGALIIGLHVKAEKNAIALAKNKGVQIKLFDVIYHMVEYIEENLEKRKKVEISWKKIGQLVVKKVFDFKKIGIIAGCAVQEGIVTRNSKIICRRGGQIVGEGMITSLQREGKIVKEVHAGYECAFVCDAFNDWQEGDIVEVYEKVLGTE